MFELNIYSAKSRTWEGVNRAKRIQDHGLFDHITKICEENKFVHRLGKMCREVTVSGLLADQVTGEVSAGHRSRGGDKIAINMHLYDTAIGAPVQQNRQG